MATLKTFTATTRDQLGKISYLPDRALAIGGGVQIDENSSTARLKFAQDPEDMWRELTPWDDPLEGERQVQNELRTLGIPKVKEVKKTWRKIESAVPYLVCDLSISGLTAPPALPWLGGAFGPLYYREEPAGVELGWLDGNDKLFFPTRSVDVSLTVTDELLGYASRRKGRLFRFTSTDWSKLDQDGRRSS